MKKNKTKIIVMFVSTILFIATIGLIISINKIDKQTENTTTSYIATVIDVDITDTGNGVFAEIYTNEYNTTLYISTNICKNIRMDDVKNLEKGETIFFRIENMKVKQMGNVRFVNIISLKTETENIFTLNQYNKSTSNSVFHTRIAGVAMSLFFFFIALFNYLSVRKNKTGSGNGKTGNRTLS